jgi:hypothetical protein
MDQRGRENEDEGRGRQTVLKLEENAQKEGGQRMVRRRGGGGDVHVT